jgi:DNA modification methylase
LLLIKALIKTTSRENATILDCFAGSGTTVVAAKELGRNYIAIEKEKKYCEIAEARIQTARTSSF